MFQLYNHVLCEVGNQHWLSRAYKTQRKMIFHVLLVVVIFTCLTKLMVIIHGNMSIFKPNSNSIPITSEREVVMFIVWYKSLVFVYRNEAVFNPSPCSISFLSERVVVILSGF